MIKRIKEQNEIIDRKANVSSLGINKDELFFVQCEIVSREKLYKSPRVYSNTGHCWKLEFRLVS